VKHDGKMQVIVIRRGVDRRSHSPTTARSSRQRQRYQTRTDTPDTKRTRIAIIGGGIGGSFASKYLAEYDADRCLIDSITVFDPSPQLSRSAGGKGIPGGPPSGGTSSDLGPNRQGSRVSSLTLADGTVVELGASIIFSGNELISQVVNADPNLERAEPLSPGKDKRSREDGGFGIYDGGGGWPLIVDPNTPDYLVVAKMLYRYGLDLWKVRSEALKAFKSFQSIYRLLDSEDSSFDSPDHLWGAVGLYDMTRVSFDDYLTQIGVSGGGKLDMSSSWWDAWHEALLAYFMPLFDFLQNWFLPKRGNLRREICESININNYNQNNGRLNGLAGLVSFLPSQGSVYSVLGGNAQLLFSAFQQANNTHFTGCNNTVRHIQSAVASVVVIGDDSIQLITEEGNAEDFDIVVLAAPLQQSQIQWSVVPNDNLPPSTRRRYTQTVTTIVSNGTLQSEYFHISNSSLPKAVSLTEKGKDEDAFSCLAELTEDGTFKVFSSESLTDGLLEKLFGEYYQVQYQKIWGGKSGGAYPDFDGGGDSSTSAPFLLYGDHKSGPAVYYANAMEASVAAMEISAIGAKAVSKLVARRLGLLA